MEDAAHACLRNICLLGREAWILAQEKGDRVRFPQRAVGAAARCRCGLCLFLLLRTRFSFWHRLSAPQRHPSVIDYSLARLSIATASAIVIATAITIAKFPVAALSPDRCRILVYATLMSQGNSRERGGSVVLLPRKGGGLVI